MHSFRLNVFVKGIFSPARRKVRPPSAVLGCGRHNWKQVLTSKDSGPGLCCWMWVPMLCGWQHCVWLIVELQSWKVWVWFSVLITHRCVTLSKRSNSFELHFHVCIYIYVCMRVPNQFSSVTQSCPTLCNPMDCSTPGLPVLHQLLELTQTHVHWVSDAIQLSHSLPFPSPPAFSLSQHQGLFQGVRSSHQVAKVLKLQLQHQSFQWIFRTCFL